MVVLMAVRSAVGECGVDGEKLFESENYGKKTDRHLIPRRVRAHNLLRVAV